MKHSESIKELATALAKAQAEFGIAAMDKVNPHFKTKYATLASIMESCRKTLSQHGLALVQSLKTENGHFLETMLLHSSGEWIAFDLVLYVDKQSMQGLGSAITYARRYGIITLLGIVADDDDDGNGAESSERSPLTEKFISEAQQRRLWTIATEYGWDESSLKQLLLPKGIKSSREVPVKQYEALVNFLMNNKPKENV